MLGSWVRAPAGSQKDLGASRGLHLSGLREVKAPPSRRRPWREPPRSATGSTIDLLPTRDRRSPGSMGSIRDRSFVSAYERTAGHRRPLFRFPDGITSVVCPTNLTPPPPHRRTPLQGLRPRLSQRHPNRMKSTTTTSPKERIDTPTLSTCGAWQRYVPNFSNGRDRLDPPTSGSSCYICGPLPPTSGTPCPGGEIGRHATLRG